MSCILSLKYCILSEILYVSERLVLQMIELFSVWRCHQRGTIWHLHCHIQLFFDNFIFEFRLFMRNKKIHSFTTRSRFIRVWEIDWLHRIGSRIDELRRTWTQRERDIKRQIDWYVDKENHKVSVRERTKVPLNSWFLMIQLHQFFIERYSSFSFFPFINHFLGFFGCIDVRFERKKEEEHDEKEMDFHGQKLSETIYQILILAFSVRSSICECVDVFSLSLLESVLPKRRRRSTRTDIGIRRGISNTRLCDNFLWMVYRNVISSSNLCAWLVVLQSVSSGIFRWNTRTHDAITYSRREKKEEEE